MSRQRSLDQQRAARAWDCVQDVKDQRYAAKYSALARGAPADIQANGLGPTLAFWRARGYEKEQPKANSEHERLLAHLSNWLREQRLTAGDNLVAWIAKTATSDAYRRATTEAMAFLGWLKRFAEAELPRDDTAQGARSE